MLIKPVWEFILETPGAAPFHEYKYESGVFEAVIWYVTISPTYPVRANELVMVGGTFL